MPWPICQTICGTECEESKVILIEVLGGSGVVVMSAIKRNLTVLTQTLMGIAFAKIDVGKLLGD